MRAEVRPALGWRVLSVLYRTPGQLSYGMDPGYRVASTPARLANVRARSVANLSLLVPRGRYNTNVGLWPEIGHRKLRKL